MSNNYTFSIKNEKNINWHKSLVYICCNNYTMSIEMASKINKLLSMIPQGTIVQSSWLIEQGYSASLQQRYRKNNWLKSVGKGAMIRAGDKVSYEGAIYALQKQDKTSIHPGGKTALTLLGNSHFLPMGEEGIVLFGDSTEKLPSWFSKFDWGRGMDYHSTSFLPKFLGLTEISFGNFSIQVSDPIRAAMECIYLARQEAEFIECFDLIQGLNNLRPGKVEETLENCESIKVKRLFLYLSDRAGHEWFKHLSLEKVDLGKGKRSLVDNGTYIAKYQITVPKELSYA